MNYLKNTKNKGRTLFGQKCPSYDTLEFISIIYIHASRAQWMLKPRRGEPESIPKPLVPKERKMVVRTTRPTP